MVRNVPIKPTASVPHPTRPGLRRWWVLPLIYVIFIGYQSLVGANIWNCKRELTSPFLKALHELSFSDLIANVLAYVPLGFLVAAPRISRSVGMAMLWALVCGFLLSALMETLQLCLPGRVPSSFDLMANTVGSVAGGLLAWVWASMLEAHVPTQLRDADRALHLKAGALRLLAILALLCWIAYQTEPWVFTFDLGQLRANLSWLKRLDTWSWNIYAWFRHFGAWMAMLLAIRLSIGVRPDASFGKGKTRLWLQLGAAALGLAMLAQLGLEKRSIGPEEVTAMVAAFIVCAIVALMIRRESRVQSLLSVLVSLSACISLIAYQIEPGAVAASGESGKFHWLPQVGRHQLIHAIDYALFFAWFGVMLAVAACARPTGLWRFQSLAGQMGGAKSGDKLVFALGWKLPLAVAVFVEATELLQFWIPGRGIDSSPVIFTLLGYFFANRMVTRTAPAL